MNCTNCSQPLAPGAQFCGNCGAVVFQQPVTPVAQPQPESQQQSQPPFQPLPQTEQPPQFQPQPPQQPVATVASDPNQFANNLAPVLPVQPQYAPAVPAPINNPIAAQFQQPQQGQYPQQSIKNHRTFGILVAIFCSLPLGLIALIYSGKVDTALKLGSVEEATKASKTAKTLNIIGVCIGVPLTILYIIGTVAGA